MIGGDVPFYAKIWWMMAHPFADCKWVGHRPWVWHVCHIFGDGEQMKMTDMGMEMTTAQM